MRRPWMYSVGRVAVGALARHGLACQVAGASNIPKEGPLIVAINHQSYWDPPLVAMAVERPVHFLAKEALFRMPLLGGLLRSCGALPVRRFGPNVGTGRRALQILANGGVIGIFPEGTCNALRSLLPPWSGVGWFALRAGVPVVPIAITGLRRFGVGRSGMRLPIRAKVEIHPPLVWDQAHYRTSDRLFRTLASHQVMDTLRACT